jgi:hypothetical protein
MIGGSSGGSAARVVPRFQRTRRLRRVLGGLAVGVVALVLGSWAARAGAGDGAPVVEQVVEVPAGMTATVQVVDTAGEVVKTGDLVNEPLRITGLHGGTYHLVTQAETPVEQHGDVAISAAVATRGDPFDLPPGSTLVVAPLGPRPSATGATTATS